MTDAILEVVGLSKFFSLPARSSSETRFVKAVDNVDFVVKRGKTFGIVGESGSGKTTIGKMVVRLYQPTSGSVVLEGVDIARLPERKFRQFRGKLQMVFQDPSTSLNPKRKIGSSLVDPISRERMTNEEKHNRAVSLLEKIGLTANYFDRYPHELSGGQKQRICIGRAVISQPKVVVLDEPTSALDVSVQAQIVTLLTQLQRDYGLTYVFISHNLTLVRNVADEIAVLYLGRVVEQGPTTDVYKNPKHPYTAALLSVTPVISDEDMKALPKRIPLLGEIPSLLEIQVGCRYASRCPYRMAKCTQKEPDFVKVGSQLVRCYLYEEGGDATLRLSS